MSYTFGDVVEINGLTTNQLKRWTQIGLIKPQGKGDPSAGWRKFTFRNLIEARVCDQLRALNVAEALLQQVVHNLTRLFDGADLVLGVDDVGKVFRDVPVYYLYIGRVRFSLPPDETEHERLMLQWCDPARLHAILDSETDSGVSETGIVIPVSRIITDLERLTGDVFDFQGALRKAVEREMAKDPVTFPPAKKDD
jgi:hypothetical protein